MDIPQQPHTHAHTQTPSPHTAFVEAPPPPNTHTRTYKKNMTTHLARHDSCAGLFERPVVQHTGPLAVLPQQVRHAKLVGGSSSAVSTRRARFPVFWWARGVVSATKVNMTNNMQFGAGGEVGGAGCCCL